MKKKILFVIHSLGSGGAEKALVNLLNEVDLSKYEIYLQCFINEGVNFKYLPEDIQVLPAITEKYPEILSLKKLFLLSLKKVKLITIFKIIKVGLIMLRKKSMSQRRKDYYVWKILKTYIPKIKEKYDVAIGFMHGIPTYYIIDLCDAEQKDVWVHIDYAYMDYIEAEKNYFKKAHAVYTISEHCTEVLKTRFPDIKNFYCIYNINSSKMIRKLSAEKGNPYQSEKKGLILLTSGRFTAQKGYDFAVKAGKILKDNGVSFKWFFMGRGELESDIKHQISQNQLEGYFTFLGIQENPYPYMKYSDVIVQPSRYEGKSMVLDEAKILCKPIVVTNYSSVTDQITAGYDGLIVNMNENDIADGIMKMCSEDQRRVFEKNLEEWNKIYDCRLRNLVERYEKMLDGSGV